MDSFLHLLAGDMAREHLANLHRLTVILPNKRAGLFLARELAGLIDRPAWMPAIVTLEEFVETHAGLKRADDLALVIKLYRAYRQASGTEETFDDFYFWGNMLLEDFNDVDKYLVDARDLFSNLHALKEVERSFPYLSEEQITLIRRFWSHFRQGACSREQLSFLQTWERLHPTYLRFRQGLLDEGLCYEGMGLRLLLDHLDAVPPDDILLFAGFNALNACENKIFAHFRDNGQARFYWDHDTYYTDNPAHEAGIFLRHNLKQFPNAIPPENFDNLRRPGKRVEEIAVPSVVAQAKLLPLLLDEFAPAPRVQTAIVLCDERLLTPVIHSIPPAVEKINITMGYPARNTAAAALL
ncbi:MAG: PD-(D/E)XK nuclease family protein, partial [Odoribacteraceae bacterium]|nr:PD-(D/E)XK nuclease family protein [Odoribacteraceae bacterium]